MTTRVQLLVCLVLAGVGAGSAVAINQCNLGNKLYSIENGGTVCAPLAPYQCITSCQWNTSCAHTAHSLAFQGRRTFVAGMIMTAESFLLLCCASFANVVQQNQRLENRCVWVPPIQTIENGPSIRFDPPLSQNEYVRDMAVQRLDRGKVEVRVQICKFMTQRTNCDEQSMPPDDQQLLSLLQLRLSRTEAFLRQQNGTSPADFFHVPSGLEEVPTPTQDSFRDEVFGGDAEQLGRGEALFNQRRISSQLRAQAPAVAPPARTLAANRVTRLNAAERGLRTSADRVRRIPPYASSAEAAADDLGGRGVPQARAPQLYPKPTAGRLEVRPGTLLNGGSGARPTAIVARQGVARPPAVVDFGELGRQRPRAPVAGVPLHNNIMNNNIMKNNNFNPNNNNNLNNNLAPTVDEDSVGASVDEPRRSAARALDRVRPRGASARFANGRLPDQLEESGGDAVFSFSGGGENAPAERLVFSTNQSREAVRPRHAAAEPHLEERPMKSSLAIRKLHLGTVRGLGGFAQPTSFGGSFASAEQTPTARSLRTFSSQLHRELSAVRPLARFGTGLSGGAAPRARGPAEEGAEWRAGPHFVNNSAYRTFGFANTAAVPEVPKVRPLPPGVAPHQQVVLAPIQPQQSAVLPVQPQRAIRPQPSEAPGPQHLRTHRPHPIAAAATAEDAERQSQMRAQFLAVQQQQSHFQQQVQQQLGRRQQLQQQQQQQQLQQQQQQEEEELQLVQEAQQRKESTLRGLLQCCQEQAPGCRHLCSPTVSKEEIKRAIQTNQCPPLSMTSVLQCFPRFYDISAVGQCCNRAATDDPQQQQQQQQQQQPVQSVIGFLAAVRPAARLPGQCQSLCAPNFKLSFSHFACVDHINTIVDCYRDLLAR